MRFAERLGMAALRRLDPELAHDLALKGLHTPFAPLPGPISSDRLATTLSGLDLPNPIGLAAGFDKNAVAVGPLMRAGFGFVEVGAATPRPQPGNPAPRLFRLAEDRAAINRFGFNNDGADRIAARLATRPRGVPVGINLGANKHSADRSADFARVLETCGPHVDFATVNVSSPNTESLRELQRARELAAVLDGVLAARGGLERRIPVFLKISPDVSDSEIEGIAEVASSRDVEAIIATNTTLSREGLVSPLRGETGGLSGVPLFRRSTEILRRLHRITGGRTTLIGVGGISNADDAIAKFRAGASAVQLYTGLIYGGLSLAARIAREIDARLEREGETLSNLIGRDA